jgi:type I restriction enzyme M protein
MEEVQDDLEPFETRIKKLTSTLGEQFAESARLEEQIRVALEALHRE